MAGAAERRWMPMVPTQGRVGRQLGAAKSGHSRVPPTIHGHWAASPPMPLPPPRRRRPRHHRCSLHLSLAGAPLCLGPLYWTAARRCRLSPVLVGGISFSGTNKSMAPWFCTKSLVRQPPSDTTGFFTSRHVLHFS
ncbi:uncharacterized protein LOC119308979 [Triticum dicoccoides]|uniref:uncharacterized protein LOC119308979 n=1 Tax=Triticum dicoccoides TaxID=85692 RepID=UPI001890C068|nr:uncharacterized protein LOC119308979 [Triticum dicoccoides]XP_044388584.1 uncharacterized protein LOC123111776 [Triticum aestivum]XP_044450097.1 uncharacterized protein LOC123181797 [Triticum aestivum]